MSDRLADAMEKGMRSDDTTLPEPRVRDGDVPRQDEIRDREMSHGRDTLEADEDDLEEDEDDEARQQRRAKRVRAGAIVAGLALGAAVIGLVARGRMRHADLDDDA